MGTLFVDKLDPQSGTSLELGSSGDTISVPSGATFDVPSGATLDVTGATVSGLTIGDNKPFFYAFQQNAQNFSTGAHTVVSFDSERYDTESKFNTSNYRFTPAVAGYYFLYAHMRFYTSDDFNMFEVSIRKNGSNAAKSSVEHDHNGTCSVSTIIESDADDYFDVEVMQNQGGTQGSYVGYQNTYFMGYNLTT